MTRPLLLASLLSIALASCTDVERCRVGTHGCECDNSGCDTPDLVCEDGICESCIPGQTGCECTSAGTCTGAGASCTSGVCTVSGETVCMDACRYANDGACDDGGSTSGLGLCAFGTDCSDCGPRANPCAELNAAYPVYCPQTPDVASGECWGVGTFCPGLVYCEDDEAHACLGNNRYDCATSSCTPTPCTNPAYSTYCPYAASCATNTASCCFPSNVDCRTATQCESRWVTCWTGERVDCGGAGAADDRCVLDLGGD